LTPSLPSSYEGIGADARIGVKQAAHGIWAREALPGVLAMNVEQHFAQGAQLGGSGWAAIDPCAAFALRVDAASQ